MAEYELYHYGVQGMKWGVRRAAKKAAKDTKRQQAGRNAVTAFVGLGLTVGTLVANRYR